MNTTDGFHNEQCTSIHTHLVISLKNKHDKGCAGLIMEVVDTSYPVTPFLHGKNIIFVHCILQDMA